MPILSADLNILESGIDCWNWLLTERPEFEQVLLAQVLFAWKGCLDRESGVFAASDRFVFEMRPISQNAETRLLQ